MPENIKCFEQTCSKTTTCLVGCNRKSAEKNVNKTNTVISNLLTSKLDQELNCSNQLNFLNKLNLNSVKSKDDFSNDDQLLNSIKLSTKINQTDSSISNAFLYSTEKSFYNSSSMSSKSINSSKEQQINLSNPIITVSSSNESTNDESRSKNETNNMSKDSIINSSTNSSSNSSINSSTNSSTNSSINSSTNLTTTSSTASSKISSNDVKSVVKLDELKTTNKQSWLLRLFESKLFNTSLALIYLNKSKEPGVLTYIGNKLFQFDKDEVDFYLPQLVTLYINNPDICDAIRPYFLSRCKESIHFSLHLIWLLQSFCFENKNCHPLIKVRNSGLKLKQLILSEELWYGERQMSVNSRSSLNVNNKFSELNCNKLLELDNDKSNCSIKPIVNNNHYLTVKKTHQRSFSETTSNLNKTSNLIELQLNPSSSNQSLNQHLLNQNHILNQSRIQYHKIGDLHSGQAFDNQCFCMNTRSAVCNELKGEKFKCTCGAPRLLAENEFVKCLINIGTKLQCLNNKELRMQRLIAELQLLNLNLPAKVWSPLHDHINHLVVRIPPQNAVLLNSKDKAPFLIFIEIVKIDSDINTAILPTKTNSLMNSLRHTRSEENLLNYHQQLKYNISSNCLVNSSNCKLDSLEFNDQSAEIRINASDIRKRLTNSIKTPKLNELNSDDLEDSNAVVLTESKIKQIRANSPFGHLLNWDLVSCIVKCGDDLRQEMMCYQLLSTFKKIFQMEKVPLYIRPYKIYVFSADAGLIEPVLNTTSLSQIKVGGKIKTLLDFFKKQFGPINSEGFLTAQRKFVQSCAAYSIVSYLIQLKDRHNDNLLLDHEGHLLHIDYGFILSNSPRNLGFENSPFKLTDEIVEVMGGVDSDMFKYYKILILQGLIAARKHHEKLVSLVEILQSNTQLPCFKFGSSTIKSLTDRFHIKLTEEQLQTHIEQLVENSIYSITTRLYDSFQYYTNNIL